MGNYEDNKPVRGYSSEGWYGRIEDRDEMDRAEYKRKSNCCPQCGDEFKTTGLIFKRSYCPRCDR